jgi:hypothetical protein
MCVREGRRDLWRGPALARDVSYRAGAPCALRPRQSGHRPLRPLHRRGHHAPHRSCGAGVEPLGVLDPSHERGKPVPGAVVRRRSARGVRHARRLPHAPDDLRLVGVAALDTVAQPPAQRLREPHVAHAVLLGHVVTARRLLVGGSRAICAPAPFSKLSVAGHLRSVLADRLRLLVHRRPEVGTRVALGLHRALLRAQPGPARHPDRPSTP